jgi:hypothetical protein
MNLSIHLAMQKGSFDVNLLNVPSPMGCNGQQCTDNGIQLPELSSVVQSREPKRQVS